MLAAVCHGKKDLRIEAVNERSLAPGEVRMAIAYGGICNSDLRNYHYGAVGEVRVREPLILGHELSGTVIEVAPDVKGLSVGMKAAIDPSRACLKCANCRAGRSNLCTDMWFLGCIGRFPHSQGGFSEHLVVRHDQVVPVLQNTDLLKLSLAESLSVGLHAISRAGALTGKRVVVTGSGPIGLLTARSAKLAGAVEVVCTDIEDVPLAIARDHMGATRTINVRKKPYDLAAFELDGGFFDVAFEASGSADALTSLFRIVRRGGRIVQVGAPPPGTAPVPMALLQARELELVGAFRANDEFRTAVHMIVNGNIDVTPILSATFALQQAQEALELAADRSKVVKVNLAIAPA